ncbi:chalcone isomerase family protein [Aquimarina rhabdastrellae]
MRNIFTLIIIFLIGIINCNAQTRVGGMQFNDSEKIGDIELILNGAGVRKDASSKLYAAGLYVDFEVEGKQDDMKVANMDATMGITIKVISNIITPPVFEEMLRNGLEKSTEGNSYKIEDDIRKFLGFFRGVFSKHEIYKLIYKKGDGLYVYKNMRQLGKIDGLEFKKAIFGMWLGDDPIDAELKTSLLGDSGDNPIFGKWKSYYVETGVAKSIIEIYTIKGEVYGVIDRMLRESERDAICYDCKGEDKNQEVEGLVIIKKLRKSGSKYSGGTFTNIEDGKVSSCQIWIDEDNQNLLNVKYKGSGGTQQWKRVR